MDYISQYRYKDIDDLINNRGKRYLERELNKDIVLNLLYRYAKLLLLLNKNMERNKLMVKLKISAIISSLFTILSIAMLLIDINFKTDLNNINFITDSKRTIVSDGVEAVFVAQKTGSNLQLIVISAVLILVTIVLWSLCIKQKKMKKG